MIFNSHSKVEGKHALLSPSNYHWIRYDDQKLQARFNSYSAARRGTDLHKFANDAIRLKMKLSASKTVAPYVNKTMALYVSDAIDYDMESEQPLYYSENCFGTADAICFRRNTLRIFDLKTGLGATSFEQLFVYAAIFCLEYGKNPFEINTDLRLYQSGEVLVMNGPDQVDPAIIDNIMHRIVELDMKIDILKEGGLL